VAIVDEIEPQIPVLCCRTRSRGDLRPPVPARDRLRSLIRDDIDDEFSMLANLRRVVAVRSLLERREKVGILLQPDPDPDGIAGGYALRAVLGRRRPTAPLISFGEVKRPENIAMVRALGVEIRTVTPDELSEFDALALVDVQPPVFGESRPRACCRSTS
jgi:hypothetical protein